ncbi:YceH family protein [Iodobacter fluviatilis]|jgi:hypothetical protein|uniref:DUF480 domain-containing protein n=1 Tax=Iodobacter fluviatilis TaxID=537 RepID=A0A7G3G6R6_9NEIS|nr:YceH family protein [Iodobacter fluviatilis]QBC42961.1 DUF480 domain-containing protein [Iodobacter fluviatilis]
MTFLLSLLETRILGALIEKQITVPDTYPLSLNSLVSACNQKSNRDPVMEVNDTEVDEALVRLKELKLVEGYHPGGRIARYSQHFAAVLQIPSQSVAILAALMLRGPQTAGELRLACERLHKFSDISAVEGFLEELAERSADGLVVKLPRAPSARECRWAHLLSGEPVINEAAPSAKGSTDSALQAKVDRLEIELFELKEKVAKICAELGMD